MEAADWVNLSDEELLEKRISQLGLKLEGTELQPLTQQLYDEAKRDGWTVISMKNDWKRIFAFE